MIKLPRNETTEDGQELIDKFRDALEKMVVKKEIILQNEV